jgi:hypothetical protein
MANHPQADSTAKGDVSDRSQAIYGSSAELSSATWLDMRTASGYLDAFPQRFSLYDCATSANSAANATDAPLTIRTGVAKDGASSDLYSLPKIDFFDSAATTTTTSEKPQAGGMDASQAKPPSNAGNESTTTTKFETYTSTYVGNSNGAYN